jgi:hypothetical protein
LLLHVRHHAAHALDRREQLDLDVLAPSRVVRFVECHLSGTARVVDEDIDAPETLYRLVDKALHVLGRIPGHRLDLNTQGFDLLRRFRELFGAARQNRDVRSLPRESQRGCPADPFAATGNCRDLTL